VRNHIVAELTRRGDVSGFDLSCEVVELIGLVIVPSNIRNEMVANASRADGLATAETPLIRNAWYVVAASDEITRSLTTSLREIPCVAVTIVSAMILRAAASRSRCKLKCPRNYVSVRIQWLNGGLSFGCGLVIRISPIKRHAHSTAVEQQRLGFLFKIPADPR